MFTMSPGVTVGPFNWGSGTVAASVGQTIERTGARVARSLRRQYFLRFRRMFEETVVIYCTSKNRAWLAPEINVILYMIRIGDNEGVGTLPELNYPRKRSLAEA
jgi:hypothetical protein